MASVPGVKFFYQVKVCSLDSDLDGWMDHEEFAAHTNPFLADSDGDGVSDYEEALAGADPCDYRKLPFDAAHPPQYADLWVDANAVVPSVSLRDGSRDFPFATIADALSAAQAGDLIAIRAGEYAWHLDGNVLIDKPLRLVGVDGPAATNIYFVDDGEALLEYMVIYDPAWDTDPGWSMTKPVGGPEVIPGPNPMTVEVHGLHFSRGLKAPLFYVRPKTRLVLTNCLLNSLLCGVAQCDSSELVMLNCQVAENGDGSRYPWPGFAIPPPGEVLLRGNSIANIWHCSFVNNVKETDGTATLVHGTINLRDASQLTLRNSVLWEETVSYLGTGNEPNNPHPEYSSATHVTRKLSLEIAPTAFADVQSCLIYEPSQSSVRYPSPTGGAQNLPGNTNPGFYFFNSAATTLNERQFNPRTRRLGYTGAVPSPLADGVTSAALDTSSGLVGPVGFRRHLKYDLEGHARQSVYRQTGAALAVKADVGALECVATMNAVTINAAPTAQPAWTDLAVVPNGGSVMLAAPESSGTASLLTVDPVNGRAFSGVGVLNLSSFGPQAMCYDTATNALLSLGDMRRGSVALSSLSGGGVGAVSGSSSRGCLDQPNDLLLACLHTDHHAWVLGASTIPFTGGFPGTVVLRETAAADLDTFLASGDPGQSPYRQQPDTGLRAAIRGKLKDIVTTGPAYTSVKAVNAYPDGVIIAYNTAPKFGQPLAGQTYAVGSALPYDGGGPTATAGTVIVAQAGASTAEQMAVHVPAGSPLILYYRAWAYSGNGPARVYGPALEATVNNNLAPPEAQKFPLVINEVMSGPGGWVEVFNTSGEPFTVGNPLWGTVKLVANVDGSEISTTPTTVEASLAGITFPARGFKVFAVNTQATATAARGVSGANAGKITSLAITSITTTTAGGGGGYTTPPLVTITGGGGSGANYTAVLKDGAVDRFTVVNMGSGYTSTPTVTIAPPPLAPGEVAFVRTPPQPATVQPTSRVRFDATAGAAAAYDFYRGKDRAKGLVSQGRNWDAGPRGRVPVSPDTPANTPDEGAAFAGSPLTNPEHPITRGASNTANYSDVATTNIVGTVCQPYLQAVMKSDQSKVWLCWRNIGNLGCTWEGDGLRHDFASMRLEGSGFNAGTVATGLRMPLTERVRGNALVMEVPVSKLTTASNAAWETVTATKRELNLNHQGIRALQWCPQVDGTGKFLIISGPPTTDPAVDHPMTGRFALWSWAGGTEPAVLRIPDLAPFCHYPTGVVTFLLGGQARIGFAEGAPAATLNPEQAHLSHWPLTILKPLPPPS